MTDPSRRTLLKSAAALASSTLLPSTTTAQTLPSPTTTPTTTTSPTTTPTEPNFTPSDLDTADRVVGRPPLPNPEQSLATGLVTRRSRVLKTFRAANAQLPYSASTGLHFSPYLPDQPPPPPSPKAPFKRSSAARPFAWDGHLDSLAFASLLDLAELLRTRRLTATALTRFFLDRLKRLGPALHCVVTLTEDLALSQAAAADTELAAGHYRGPLHGIPYGAKDLFAARNYPTTCGISPWKDRVLDHDATLITRLRDAGAILCAKLSLGELAMGDIWFGGLTRNPWKPDTGSSGSSAGSASAVAAGLLPFALGTETMGSIVAPCCTCGTTGLRPTFGMLSRYGAMPLTPSMDKPGPICRSVEDAAAILHVLAGPDPLDPTTAHSSFAYNPDLDLTSLSIGYDADAFSAVQRRSPETYKPYADALEWLKSLGITPKPLSLPRDRTLQSIAGAIISVEGTAALSELSLTGQLSQLVQQQEGSWPNSFRCAEHVPAADYLRMLRLREIFKTQWSAALKGIDAYIAIPLSGVTLLSTNLTGHPTLITRASMKDNLPQMIEFTGNLHQEPTLLALAAAYERATPHPTQWPKDPS